MIILAANSGTNGNGCHAFSPQLFMHRGIERVSETGGAIVSSRRSRRSCEARVHTILSNSKWDDVVDEDELLESEYSIPPDMKYIPRNVVRQHTNFCDIREAGGVQMTNDVYVRDPTDSSNTFWFVGKVARVSDVSLAQCVARQYPLVEQHAVQLRPLELSKSKLGSTLELWTAPGDSELQVAYNKPDLIMEKMERHLVDEDAAAVNKNYVGFQGEIYQQGEDGFRTWRTDDGRAAKPEITPATSSTSGSEHGDASQEEMDRLLKVMDGLDVNELYKQQERREGREVED